MVRIHHRPLSPHRICEVFLYSPIMYYFYILYSQAIDKYYLGHTRELYGRIRRHNTNHKGFTGKANDWALVYKEEYKDKSEAYRREREVKNWKNRRRVENLVKSGYISD